MERRRGSPDFLLLFMTLALVGFGILMVFSSSYILAYYNPDYNNDSLYFVKKQAIWAILGFIAMLFTMNIPYTVYKQKFPTIAIGSFILLLLLFTPLGMKINGARSWLGIGKSFSIQPAEFAKLGLIIYLAGLIAKKGDRFRMWKQGLAPALIATTAFCGMVMLQPDLGTTSIILFTAVVIMFSGGAHLKHLGMLCGVASVALIIFAVAAPYRLARIKTFINPWNDGMNGLEQGYHLIQSFYAIANGGLSGAGFGKSIQKYLYLPYPQTDFIFSVIAEEIGFFGCALFILFFVLFLWRIILITLRCEDTFGLLVGIGVVSMIGIQAIINIGGVTGSMPITGVPLPFVSYGGSSLLVFMTSMGIVLSISRETFKKRAQRQEQQLRKLSH
ncbi:cell division protein FtsW [Ammoniphilus oxalaticus]|uniref:Probable peptidoglycan glycosyltransferase FtsW n=1 Tax=Ammoniphilus oxalaticus TaxID=66863 RepID=A0A419SMJ4_9BACL|nr:putative lipid II flippase FtsW [Ammoniphilus oxalaticus]RKD25514.1 cell division protein FtsW [Ammoniphilus oxalaticus]